MCLYRSASSFFEQLRFVKDEPSPTPLTATSSRGISSRWAFFLQVSLFKLVEDKGKLHRSKQQILPALRCLRVLEDTLEIAAGVQRVLQCHAWIIYLC
ncbi:hypothetical protein M378DRAFT_156118 [Amanita muscaria Koide BX008]|uniref:Uncharacterized protein n=1 Tax=Amanita muscaria (strain Koide BX008) TaxID=946122 RepID=A0A0C2XLU7_AMAMK|nr:hypothetical protein M378DRAFT_156118 [Amanita muscaria Koide BX008]